MKKSWDDACDAWTYELEDCDIVYEERSPSEEFNLTLIVCTPEQDKEHKILVGID